MKKGFTLMELLAVIVILAVIATIAMPLIGHVIETGKIGAIENSSEIYIRELETKYSEWVIEGIPDELTKDVKSEPGYIKFLVEELNDVLKIKGTKPISGNIKIDNDYSSGSKYFGYVIEARMVYENGYIATYEFDIFKGKPSVEVKKI